MPDNLTICMHCDHFVEIFIESINYFVESQTDTIAKHIHCCDGEQGFDHDAEPGETRTIAEWVSVRPALFTEYLDGKVGPNTCWEAVFWGMIIV